MIRSKQKWLWHPTCLALVLTVSPILTGCSGSSNDEYLETTSPVTPIKSESMDSIAQMLTETALRAESAMTRLSLMQSNINPVSAEPTPRFVPPALLRTITIQWTGPLDDFVRELADKSKFTYIAQGKRPAQPIMIDIDARDKPIIIVLKEAGIQARTGALLRVDTPRKALELTYAGIE